MRYFPDECIFLWHREMLLNRIKGGGDSSEVFFASSKGLNSEIFFKIETT